MRRFTIPILGLGLSLAACGADESFDPGLWGGGKAEQGASDALQNCGNATMYFGVADCGDTYATAAKPQTTYIDDRVVNNYASDQDSIHSPEDVDYWVVGMKDMPTGQFSGDLIHPWVRAWVASSKTQAGNYRRADPSLKIEVCIYYKWNSGFAGNGGCDGGKKQTVDGVTACCAVVAPGGQSKTGQQALLELPDVARSVKPDSGELVIRARASEGSDGCGVYHVSWGTRVDSSEYYLEKGAMP